MLHDDERRPSIELNVAVDVRHHNTLSMSPATPDSPPVFAFSPPRYSSTSGQGQSYAYGGSSYDTDMTSLTGSWDAKGKAVDRRVQEDEVEDEESFQSSSSAMDKGKGKAVERLLVHQASFEFDFELDAAANDIHAPLSLAGSGARDDPATQVYAGPSTRNGHIAGTPDQESVPPLPISEPPSVASTRPPSAMDYFTSAPTSEVGHGINPSMLYPHARPPAHQRSFSSLSMRSIKSSSSKSLASIKSNLSPSVIKGKVKAIAPSAKKLKGGLRRMLSRKGSSLGSASGSVSAAQSSSEDADEDAEQKASTSKANDSPVEANPRTSMAQSTISDVTVTPWTIEKDKDAKIARIDEGIENANSGEPVHTLKQRSKSDPAVLSTVLRDSLVAGNPSVPEVVVKLPSLPINYFNNRLPHEVQLAVLKALVELHEEELMRAEWDSDAYVNGRMWSAKNAGYMRWIGKMKGMRELVKFSRVSKSWPSLCLDGQLWSSLSIPSGPPAHLPPSFLLKIASTAGLFVRTLDLRGWPHLDPLTLRGLTRLLSNETHHDHAGRESFDSFVFSRSVSHHTGLTQVILRSCMALTSTSLHHLLQRSPHLRKLDVHGLNAVTNYSCRVIAENCGELEDLDIGMCKKLDADSVKQIFDIQNRRLVVNRKWVSKLKALKASGLKGVNEPFMRSLAKNVPHLEVLDLSRSENITDEMIEAFTEWDTAWDMPSPLSVTFEKVELSARDMGRDPTVDCGPFYKRITRLRHLNLSECSLLSDAACIHLAHCVPKLEILELAGIGDALNDDGLVKLLKTMKWIRKLDLEDADVSDATVEAVTPQPVDERERERRIKGRGGAPTVEEPQPGELLEHIILSYASTITNATLQGLIRACPCLTTLEADNTRISAETVKVFVKLSRQRKLKDATIVAVDCRNVTESTVKNIMGGGEVRARRGFRGWDSRLMEQANMKDFVDGRDGEEFFELGNGFSTPGGLDDCDETRVVLKSFWSWQGVDEVRNIREKRKRINMGVRRNTDPGVFSLRRLLEDAGTFDIEGTFMEGSSNGNAGGRRWLSGPWRDTPSGVGTPQEGGTPGALTPAREDERGCVVM